MLLHEKKKVEKLDLVTIATPNSTHFEISKAFLEAGFNIFCEKPMTMNIEEGEALLAIAKKADKIMAVGQKKPLIGLPIDHKELISSDENLTSCASNMFQNIIHEKRLVVNHQKY